MKYILISGIVILVAFLIVLSQIPLGIEPLTELYFENHTTLPKYIFLNKPYSFTFTVNNLEYQDMAYNYTIKSYDGNGTFLSDLNFGRIQLNNNQSKSISENFTMKDHFGRVKIVVGIEKDLSLETPDFKKKLWWPDPNYPEEIEIHFWVEEITGPTITIIPD